MHRPVMAAAERDRELIAHLAAERTRLGKSDVVRVRGLAATDETRLLGDIAQMLPVAIAPRGGDRENALIDALSLTRGGGMGADGFLLAKRRSHPRIVARGSNRLG
jgi:hypothetical protein